MNWLKSNILLVLIFSALNGFAESIPRDYYYVISDVESDTVKEGTCIVRGRVIDPDMQKGISGGLVSNLTRTGFAFTNDSGFYQISVPATDTTIFFYHQKYEEIICWNYDFRSGHIVTLNFVSSEKLPDGVFRVEEKPVIYLYPVRTTEVTVELDKELELTCTYPPYNEKWNVVAHPDGQLENNGRTYPYLFWEGKTKDLGLISSGLGYHGVGIETDTIVRFLENQLEEFGLNQKESTDFITYWAPRIQKKQFVVLDFFIDDMYSNMIGGMKITPSPDQTRRVYIIFQGFDVLPEVAETIYPTHESFDRSGFVVIEWGGSEITSSSTP